MIKVLKEVGINMANDDEQTKLKQQQAEQQAQQTLDEIKKQQELAAEQEKNRQAQRNLENTPKNPAFKNPTAEQTEQKNLANKSQGNLEKEGEELTGKEKAGQRDNIGMTRQGAVSADHGMNRGDHSPLDSRNEERADNMTIDAIDTPQEAANARRQRGDALKNMEPLNTQPKPDDQQKKSQQPEQEQRQTTSPLKTQPTPPGKE